MSAGTYGLERVAADRRHLVAAQVRHVSSGFTQGVVVEGTARPQGLAPQGLAQRDPRAADAARVATPMWWLRLGAVAPEGGR